MWLYTLESKGEWFEIFDQKVEDIHRDAIGTQNQDVSIAQWQRVRFQNTQPLFKGSWYWEPNVYIVYVQQKWVAKGANCSIMEMARNMVHVQTLDKSFWTEAEANTAYTRNRRPTMALDSIMLDGVCNGRRPCIAHMRVFRCVIYAIVLDEKSG